MFTLVSLAQLLGHLLSSMNLPLRVFLTVSLETFLQNLRVGLVSKTCFLSRVGAEGSKLLTRAGLRGWGRARG